MKKLLAIIILSLCFITPSQADDIRDFQIEGMSVGDSLLDYFSEKEIIKKKNYYYNTRKFYQFAGKLPSYTVYDFTQFILKDGDKNYIIHGLTGKLIFKNNIEACKEKKDEIFDGLSNMFSDENVDTIVSGTQKHGYDKSGKTLVFGTDIILTSGSKIRISCTDWNKDLKFIDNLKVSTVTKELRHYFNTEAYK